MSRFAKHTGLGDDVAFVAKKFRLDKAARKIAQFVSQGDCGCEERQKKLNKFPSILKSIK